MSQSEFNRIIRQAAEDSTFRRFLLANPRAAMRGYDLTAAERRQLLDLNESRLQELVSGLPGDEGIGDGPIDEEEAEEDDLAGDEGLGDGPIDA